MLTKWLSVSRQPGKLASPGRRLTGPALPESLTKGVEYVTHIARVIAVAAVTLTAAVGAPAPATAGWEIGVHEDGWEIGGHGG